MIRRRNLASRRIGESLKMSKLGRYNKFYAAVITAVQTGLLEYYGSERWTPVVTLALGAALVFLVPNAGSSGDIGQLVSLTNEGEKK